MNESAVDKTDIPTPAMMNIKERMKMSPQCFDPTVAETTGTEVNKMRRKDRVRRWLIIAASVALVIFLVYLLLILIYPSMNIGMNP